MWLALRQGEQDYFDRNCRPEKCALNKRREMKNAATFDMFLELMSWQRAGLDGLVVEALKVMTKQHVSAFVMFHRTLMDGLDDLAERQRKDAVDRQRKAIEATA